MKRLSLVIMLALFGISAMLDAWLYGYVVASVGTASVVNRTGAIASATGELSIAICVVQGGTS